MVYKTKSKNRIHKKQKITTEEHGVFCRGCQVYNR